MNFWKFLLSDTVGQSSCGKTRMLQINALTGENIFDSAVTRSPIADATYKYATEV